MNKININRDTKNNVLPLDLSSLISVLNSLCRIMVNLIQNILIRDGISQYIGGTSKNPMKILIQFIDKPRLVEGSKVENRFAIIFRILFF